MGMLQTKMTNVNRRYGANRIEGSAAAGQATARPKVKYPKLATRARKKSLALIFCCPAADQALMIPET